MSIESLKNVRTLLLSSIFSASSLTVIALDAHPLMNEVMRPQTLDTRLNHAIVMAAPSPSPISFIVNRPQTRDTNIDTASLRIRFELLLNLICLSNFLPFSSIPVLEYPPNGES